MEDSVNRRFEDRKEENLVLSREEEKIPFDRLSDDVIVCDIFDKLPEAKCLFNCSLVCKRFSSLVYQVSTISLLLVPEKPNLAKRFLRWMRNFFGIKDDGYIPVDELCNLKSFFFLLFNFLKNFKEVKYVNIEFDTLMKLTKEPLIIWRLDSQSDSLVMLFAKSLDSGAKVYDVLDCYPSRAVTRLATIELSLLVAREVFRSQTKLRSVAFTVSEKEGTLIFDEKGILYKKNTTKLFREFSMRRWYAPKLELPSSGRVMEDVMLFVYKGDDMVDDFLIVEKLGEGKEKIYSEAAIEMLKEEVMYQRVNRSEIFSYTAMPPNSA